MQLWAAGWCMSGVEILCCRGESGLDNSESRAIDEATGDVNEAQTEGWVANVRLFCGFRTPGSTAPELCAFVHWYEGGVYTEGHRMRCLQLASQGDCQYSIIPVGFITKMVTLQPHLTEEELCVHNHFL